MTRFEDAVLEVVRALRAGDIITYGEVAEEAGFPGAARAVGNVLSRVEDDIPWWRVVGAGGHLVAPSRVRQASRLRAEGIPVHGMRIDLEAAMLRGDPWWASP